MCSRGEAVGGATLFTSGLRGGGRISLAGSGFHWIAHATRTTNGHNYGYSAATGSCFSERWSLKEHFNGIELTFDHLGTPSSSYITAAQLTMQPLITTLHLAHLPPSLGVHVALCRNLQNATFLRQQLLDGNSEFEYALLDASTVGAFPFP